MLAPWTGLKKEADFGIGKEKTFNCPRARDYRKV